MKIRTLIAGCFAFLVSTLAMADTFNVTVNSTPLSGLSGYLAFDFTGGTPIENNTVTVSNFNSNATLGALTSTGGASGSISPGPGTLNDSQFFNELLQEVTFGSSLSFTLDSSTNFSGGIPDTFAFYLLDSTQNPYATSDPTGADSLFAISIDGTPLSPDVYTSSSATATVTPLMVATTPEPPSFWLLLLGASALALLRLRQMERASSL